MRGTADGGHERGPRYALSTIVFLVLSLLVQSRETLRWQAAGGLGEILNRRLTLKQLPLLNAPARQGGDGTAFPLSSSPPSPSPSLPDGADDNVMMEHLNRTSSPDFQRPPPLLPSVALNDYEQVVQGVEPFVRRLERFRAALYADGEDLHQQLLMAINTEPSPSPSVEAKRRARDLRAINWWPVSCRAKGIRFKRESSLKDSGPEKNTVHLVRDLETGHRYAYKLFGKPDDYTSEVAFFMAMAGHPNVARPICTQREEGDNPARAGLLLQYIEGESSLEAARRSDIGTDTLQVWAAKLLTVLQAMHRKGFVHADLKAENIMIEAGTGQLIVIDFGFAMHLPHEHPGRGNFDIKAPETGFLIQGRLHEGLDMWAYGSVLATWYGYKYLPAWQKRSAHGRRRKSQKPYVMVQIGNHRKYKFGSIPEEFPAPLRALLYLMTAPNPNLRTFNTDSTRDFVRRLRFFAGIDWEALDREMQTQ